MQNILFLVHRIPYPPNKGDKIRSWNILKFLAQRYRVYLGTFVDDPDDMQHMESVKALCADSKFVDLTAFSARLRSMTAFLNNRPLTLDYYRNADMQAWVNNAIRQNNIQRVVVFSSGVAQFVQNFPELNRIIDFVDVDSEKWEQYAAEQVWPMNSVYGREARLLQQYERDVTKQFNAALFVSQAEAELFRKIAPESKDKIGYVNNGVDTEYFSPDRSYPNPYPLEHDPIVFTGAMDYAPNVDAVQWYVEEVLPALRRERPNVAFYIVGSKPNNSVLSLAKTPGVFVTGFVADVRPYLAHARFSVAPLRMARGVQNKVLEAMSMAKVVVASEEAYEGLEAVPKQDLLVVKKPEQFFFEACDLLSKRRTEMEINARQAILDRYSWESNLAPLAELLEASSK